MRTVEIDLTDSQQEFIISDKKYCLFSGGIGSGKTFIGSYYVIKKLLEEPDTPGLIGANTYKQLHNATLATLFAEMDKLNLSYSYNKQSGILNVEGRMIYCYSLENYDSIRGIQIGYFWLDETRDTREDAFKVILGRHRHPAAKRLEGRLTSSPSGFNWLYDYFVGDKKTEEFDLIQGSSLENEHLPDGYIKSLRASYDEKAFQQEVEGKFVNITQGQIYYAFARDKNVAAVERSKKYPLWLGMDFNINPMTAVIGQVINDTVIIHDEFYLMSSDTKEMGEEIKRRYGRGLRIVPDSTGKRMQTSSSGMSDHAILEEMGFRVIRTQNPFRIDRYNTVNNLLEKKRLLINPRCKKLIRDLEQVSYKQGSSQPDTTKDSTLTHISDALGYLCYYSFPIVRPKTGISMLPR